MEKEELERIQKEAVIKAKAELTAEFQAKADADAAKAKDEAERQAQAAVAKRLEEQDAEIRKMKDERRSKDLDAWIDLRKREGKIAAVEEPRIKTFLLSLEDSKTLTYSQDGKEQTVSQGDLFREIIGKRPSLFTVLSRTGDPRAGDDATYESVGDEVDAKTKAYQVEKNEKDYRKARDAVFAAEPDLKQRYASNAN